MRRELTHAQRTSFRRPLLVDRAFLDRFCEIDPRSNASADSEHGLPSQPPFHRQSASRPAQQAQPVAPPTEPVIGRHAGHVAEPVAEHSSVTKEAAEIQMGEQAAAAGRAGECNITVDRVSVAVGLPALCRLDVHTASGNELEVILEQLAYRRAFTGQGGVSTTNIPLAPIGTQGKITARDITTGEVVEQPWTWLPLGKSGGIAGKGRLAALAQRLIQPGVNSKTATADKPSHAKRAPVNATTSTTFFDIPASGRRIAFILDISGSMAGSRIANCRQQLTAALEHLSEDAEFVVVLFSHQLVEPPTQNDWLPAHHETVQRVIEWMNGVQVGGGTLPWPAFERAFSLPFKPDSIYFLTDGDVSGIKLEDLERLRQPDPGSLLHRVLTNLFSDKSLETCTVIHTIAVDAPASEKVLQQIASDSGGEYRSVQLSD